MSNSDEALRGVIDETVLVLAPLVEAAQEPEDLMRLLAELGWRPGSAPRPLLDLASAGSSLLDAIRSEPEELPTAQVLASIGRLVGAINAIRTQADSEFPAGVDIASFKHTIGRDLLDYCVVEYLLRDRFKLGRLLKLIGIVQLIELPETGLRQPYVKRYVDWSGAGSLLTDPLTGVREAYAWSSATPQLQHLLSDVASVLEAYDLELSYFRLTAEQLAFANAGATEPLAAQLGIRLDLNDALGVPSDGAAGVQFLVRAPTAERGPAIAILPYARLNGSTELPGGDLPSLAIRGDADLDQGFAVTVAPGNEPVVDVGFLAGQPTATNPTSMELALRVPPAPGEEERIIVGTSEGSRLSLRTVTVSAGARLLSAQQLDAFVELGLEALRVVVKPAADEADSFIATLLGRDGLSVELSFGLRLSSLTGFHLTGSDGLERDFPVGVQLGPVDVRAISIGLKPDGQGFDLEVGAVVSGDIGPLAVVIDRVGFKLITRFPDPPLGNLGPLDVALAFLPPSSIGLSVDAQGVLTGGGYIGREPATGRYSGVLEFRASEVGVDALGILDSHLPGGDYALLVCLRAEFPAIQIGLGFALTGIGGLIALNRRINHDGLRARFADGTIGRILRPEDPVRNAPALITDLDTAFPVHHGSTVVGPTVRAVWIGLVHFDIGVFIELPGPSRAVVLGSARANIVHDDRHYLALRVDVLGVIDFTAKTVAFDAVLVDSQLLGTLDLTGGAAFRLAWGSSPYAVFSVGGFHPRYHPEPLAFPPTLTRVAMVHGTPNDTVHLRLEGYFAVTTNTLQFGAAAELRIRFGEWSIKGTTGFDALIEFAPFHFDVDIRASVYVAYRGHDLAGLTLTGALSGPGPVVLRAKVCIDLWLLDICFSHTFELGSGSAPPLPTVADLFDVMLAAIGPDQLRGSAADPLVRLRIASAPPRQPVLAPTGAIVWEQHLAPFDLAVSRVAGGQLPAETLVRAQSPVPATVEQDYFAPGQFIDLSDDEKLTRPTYERFGGGLRWGETPPIDGLSAQVPVTVREIRLPASRRDLVLEALPLWLVDGTPGPVVPAVTVRPESWSVLTSSGVTSGLSVSAARTMVAHDPGATAFARHGTMSAIEF